MYKIFFSPQAMKDRKLIERAGLKKKVIRLLDIVKICPYQTPPTYEKLMGNLSGFYSRRINMQHRFVYQVLPNEDKLVDETGEVYEGIVKVVRMWTHYENVR
ncbi:MAG: Txe/YoeB family addiction module toxin [Roseburia sp.]|nr:Txe/YoeB family addiction module toxin [Roseburia sp.]